MYEFIVKIPRRPKSIQMFERKSHEEYVIPFFLFSNPRSSGGFVQINVRLVLCNAPDYVSWTDCYPIRTFGLSTYLVDLTSGQLYVIRATLVDPLNNIRHKGSSTPILWDLRP